MKAINRIKQIFKRKSMIDINSKKEAVSIETSNDVVRETVSLKNNASESMYIREEYPETITPEMPFEPEVDFSWQGDLESYAKGLKVPSDSIERWISAGLLLPEELKVAEKILKILRENNSLRHYH